MPSVPGGVIDFFLHPPLGLLGVTVDTNGPYSGNNTIYEFGGVGPVSEAFGVFVRCTVIPPGLGFERGYVDDIGEVSLNVFYDRLVQVALMYSLAGGAVVVGQLEEMNITDRLILFDQALPGKIGLYVFPGVEVDLYPLRLSL